MGSGILHGEGAAGETGVFLQFQSFVICVGARRIEEQDAESVAGPAVVAEKAFEAGFFDASLLVNGSYLTRGGLSGGFTQAGVIRLGPAENGIDECSGRGTEVQRGDRSAVAGLEQRLVFGSGEDKLVGAVRVVIQQLDAGHQRTRNLPVGDE